MHVEGAARNADPFCNLIVLLQPGETNTRPIRQGWSFYSSSRAGQTSEITNFLQVGTLRPRWTKQPAQGHDAARRVADSWPLVGMPRWSCSQTRFPGFLLGAVFGVATFWVDWVPQNSKNDIGSCRCPIQPGFEPHTHCVAIFNGCHNHRACLADS